MIIVWVIYMIVVDTREPDIIYKYLAKRNVPVKRQDIDFTDYLIMHKEYVIPVERKTAPDFVQSIIDRRIFNQAYILSTLFPVSYIVVEGSISEALFEHKFREEAYIGALVSLALKRSPYGQRGHISVINVETEIHTAMFLYYLHNKVVEEDFDRLPRLNIRGKRIIDKKGVMIAMLQAIPGIGEEKARRIAEKFNSVKDIIEAPITKIASIEGISLSLAKKIKEYLT